MNFSLLRQRLVEFGLHPAHWRLVTLNREGTRQQIAVRRVGGGSHAPRWVGWAQGDHWLSLSLDGHHG